MSSATINLQQQAIDFALQEKWQESIDCNLKILASGDVNVGLYNRLGKAYSELENFAEAKKYFNLSLELDPINKVAKRGLQSVGENKKAGVNLKEVENDSLIKEIKTKIIKIKTSYDLQKDLELKLTEDKKSYVIDLKDPIFLPREKIGLKKGLTPLVIFARHLETDRNINLIELYSEKPIFKDSQTIDPFIDYTKLVDEKDIKQLMQSDE